MNSQKRFTKHLLVNHYDCRQRFNVRRFSLNRVDDCSSNPLDVANSKARVDLNIRAKATTDTGNQCSLSNTKDAKVCRFNANTNHYHDRQSYY